MKLIEIRWLDSMSEGGWSRVGDALRRATPEAMEHRTVGYLLADNKDSMILVMGRSEQGEGNERLVHDVMQIPRCSVLDVIEIGDRE